ncbi:MAG: hypothetical protein Q9174_003937 [Haloplaca sp. 1 TL-2023]
MGWLWTSGDAPKSPPSVTSSVEVDGSSTPLQGPPSVNDSPTDHDQSSTSTNTDPDAALLAYLSALENPPPSPARVSKLSQLRRNDPQNTSSDGPEIINPQSLYPTEISCRTAFDTAYHCQGLGGQLANVYRYGSFRNCSEQWSHFWFCVRTNRAFLGHEERAARVKEHYRLRDTKYRVGPSSEDVWKGRGRMLEGAFEGDLDAELKRLGEMEKAEEEGQGALKE